MKRRIFLIGLAIFLSGCSSLSREFDNRLACTSDGKAFIVSMYGPLGIASKIEGPVACIQGVQK